MEAPSFAHLSDQTLADELRRLAACERRATVDLLASLAEFDSRRLYLAAGFTSLFTYCTQQLCLSEGAAYRRIEAARTCRRFPTALGLLADGAITLTTLSLLAPLLTETNHADLLARAAHKSKRRIEIIVAELSPRPDTPAGIRRLPQRRPAALRHTAPSALLVGSSVGSDDAPPSTSSLATDTASRGVSADFLSSPPSPEVDRPAEEAPASLSDSAHPASRLRPRVTPLTPERFRLQVTVSRETHDMLCEIQDLIRHAVPHADLETIVDRAFALLRDQLLRQKAGVVLRPREQRVPVAFRSRHISAGVRRRVWARDGAQCAFVGSGGRCGERAFLEFHHVKPYAAGGGNEASNIELRCRAHNGYEAEVFFATPVRTSGHGPDLAGTG